MADATRIAAQKSPPKAERRKNVDRSAETCRHILEATIKCLDQWGYGAVTNIRVADAAGVSRGAMVHHFPTRQALIVATVEFAYANQGVLRAAELAKVPVGLERFRKIMDLCYVTQRMPEGMALNEIRIGSRSDPAIREAVTPMMSAISDDYGKMILRLAKEAGLKSSRELRGFIGTATMASRALAINTFTYPRSTVAENVLWTLQTMREDLIARELGREHARYPAAPQG
ncbi:MAG: TetR/AcrR family transcriptional regulator [Hyphomonadaceae bacterium]